KQYKNANYAKQPDITDSPSCIDPILKIRIQMPFVHGMKKDCGIFAPPDLLRQLIRLHIFDPGRYLFHISMICNLYKSLGEVTSPWVFLLPNPGIHVEVKIPWQNELEISK